MPTLYIIDGYAQFFRAYHAIRTPMTSPVTKEPTNMSFGFIGMMLKLLRGEGNIGGPPSHIVMTIDKSGDRETFRSELYPQYKANRTPAPVDLFPQVERCLKLLGDTGMPIVGVEGFEADDCIATLVTRLRADNPGLNIRIVSKDKDLKQLLDDGGGGVGGARGVVELFDIHTDQIISAGTLKDETGITPSQVVDMLTLMGDTSDNVPGVEGVGPKTAAELIAEHGTIDKVLAAARLGLIKGKRGEKIIAAADALPLSKKLIELRHDVPLSVTLAEMETGRLKLSEWLPVLRELGFNRYQDEVKRLLGEPVSQSGPPSIATVPGERVPLSGTGAPTLAKPKARSAKAGPSLFDGPGLFGQGDEAGEASAGGDGEPVRAIGEAGASTRGVYRCVRTRDDLDELVRELKSAKIFAFDTETTGLSPMICKLCGISFSTKAGTGWYVPVRSPEPAAHLDESNVLEALRPLLEDPARAKCGHNLKFDILVLACAGVQVGGIGARGIDSMVASYVIDASRSSHSMNALALALLGHTNISIDELIGSGVNQRTFDTVPLELATTYSAEDADVSLRLMEAMTPQIEAMGLGSLFRDVEMPLVEVLVTLEHNGITVDAAELDRQRERLEIKIRSIKGEIDESAMQTIGRPFNPDSPKQLAGVLFNKPSDVEPGLGLKPVKKTKTGRSTDVEVLETLAEDARVSSPIPRLIVDYRQLTKLTGTYLGALKDAINPRTGRIHASFNQTVAATGRLSSSDPNLQNIPIRTEVGREIRRAFVAGAGSVLISADYSQIELRLLAHLSRDPALIEAFLTGQDIHSAVAAQINKVPLDQVTKAQRDGAKMVNFGIVYGITPFGLARRLGVSNDEATKIIDGYKRRFAGITTFLQECVVQARSTGYVETMLKRRRPIPEIESNVPARRAFAERTAINSVVQGSAADLIKLAMVDLHARIGARQPALRGVKMLLQIHDELVFECPTPLAQDAQRVIVERMESAMTLSVPLKADSGIGTNWFEE
ncbi:MAG: DNA polymerase I [Phycisphaerales bacterium]|nr:DNA polymerase I [Phycisphaerales bacterium]